MGLALALHGFRLAKQRRGFRQLARLVKRICKGGAINHFPEPIITAIGKMHALSGKEYRFCHIPQRQMQLAEIVGIYCSLFPIFLFNEIFYCCLHGFRRLPQPAQGAEIKASPA